MSLAALHQAVLDDGRCLTLLADRGWAEGGADDAWQHTSIEEIQATARTVVGPDEPYGDRTATDMAADHWGHLAGVLAERGVHIGAWALSRLPHEVVLSDRVRARLVAR